MKRDHSTAMESGFTLLEILIAMTILIFGLTATALFSRTISQTNVFTRQHADAVHLARSHMEQLRHFRNRSGYDAILSGNSNASAPSTVYTLTWTVTTYGSPTYKVIRMQTSWLDLDGASRAVELNSIIAWSDPQDSGKILQ